MVVFCESNNTAQRGYFQEFPRASEYMENLPDSRTAAMATAAYPTTAAPNTHSLAIGYLAWVLIDGRMVEQILVHAVRDDVESRGRATHDFAHQFCLPRSQGGGGIDILIAVPIEPREHAGGQHSPPSRMWAGAPNAALTPPKENRAGPIGRNGPGREAPPLPPPPRIVPTRA